MTKHWSLTFKVFNIFVACLQNMTLGGVLFGTSADHQKCLRFGVEVIMMFVAGWASISGSLLIGDPELGGPGLTTNSVRVRVVFVCCRNYCG